MSADRMILMKNKLFAILEIALVYAVIRILGGALRSTGVVNWELQQLGWSYTGMLLFVGVPALLLFFTGRNWADYGVNLIDWQLSLDIGVKAYLVRIIPVMFLLGTTVWLGMSYQTLPGGALVVLGEILGIAVMLAFLNRSQSSRAAAASARKNIIVIVLLLLSPLLLAVMMGKLSLLVVSTILWQFLFSGFGEEFVWRGYVQSRLNQAFGRPFSMAGLQFGAGLILASLLFGVFHAFNTYDPTVGAVSLSWGWALFATFGGLFFGILREKTGSLLAPGIAHGLPDAIGEALGILFGWV